MISLISITQCIEIEVCEPFPIHHDFYNCPDYNISFPYPEACINQGTWKCEQYICTYPQPGIGSCRFGHIDQAPCCTHKEIHYVDMWFTPRNGTNSSYPGLIPVRRKIEPAPIPDRDWTINIYNLEIFGIGRNISINGTTFGNVYNGATGYKTFLSVILHYNDTCGLSLDIYINGTIVIDSEMTHSIGLYREPVFAYIPIYEMSRVEHEGGDEQIYFTSVHEITPIPEDILYLYGLGPNRSVNTELCYNITYENVTTPCDDTEEALTCATPYSYENLAIAVSVLLGISFFVNILMLLWRLFGNSLGNLFKRKSIETKMGFIELDDNNVQF